MELKSIVRENIFTSVFNGIQDDNVGMTVRLPDKVLVLDNLGMKILSACCKLNQLAEEGRVAFLEDLTKNREPLPRLEAIYFVSPTEETITRIIADFEKRKLYKAIHIFFTSRCPDNLFEKLSNAKVAFCIKTCKEIDLAFLPFESNVFLLDRPSSLKEFYGPLESPYKSRVNALEDVAEQIASFCVTLGEYPKIRYRRGFQNNCDLASLVQSKLDALKDEDSKLGSGPLKAKSQLVILDRGFDCTSLLLHELTYQAMIYDLLTIEGDLYSFKKDGKDKHIILEEADSLWRELRHKHIATVLDSVTGGFKTFVASKQNEKISGAAGLKDLTKLIKKMPQYQKDFDKYSNHIHLADHCQNKYKGSVNRLCKVEQDLAMGSDADGEEIRDPMRNINPILLDHSGEITKLQKLRIIILFILSKGGVSTEGLDKLLQHANLKEDPSLRSAVINLSLLGQKILTDGPRQENKAYNFPRKNRIEPGKTFFTESRYTPVLKDILEDLIIGKLDKESFPYLKETDSTTFVEGPITSARKYGNWNNQGGNRDMKQLPRIIFFILGGISLSETRVIYEVMQTYPEWDIFLGSTEILTPDGFLENLKYLNST